MKITLKLFALLGRYLPKDATGNEAVLDLAEGTTAGEALHHVGVPGDLAHLVLVNGVYLAPSERSGKVLTEGDALAAWPPVAGG
ncbi:MAG: MoaD/ThiS family protein [Alphaproteobacteria bacterium]|nr:MoaD/ThiS family protein [Alphaproteobacteria bacterium]